MARRRLLGYYQQFEGLSEEEVNTTLREQAAERRRTELSRQEPLDLSRTTWPDYPHPAIVNAITFAARRGLHRYLDRSSTELRSELAHRHGLDEARVVIGDGAAQLLSEAASALLEPGDELITPWPSYPLYPLMARRARGTPVLIRSDEAASRRAASDGMPSGKTTVTDSAIEPLLAAVNSRTRLMVLCNPNDPTGALMDASTLRALVEALPERVVVLVDEALREFADAEPLDATLELLEDFPRVLLFRTFSKAWGLAGLRCGYALGGSGAEPLLEHLAPELGVNELAQAGALEAVRTVADVVAQRRSAIAEHRSQLADALRELGLEAPPSQANFLWLSAPGSHGAGELAARLQRAGVIVQSGAPLGAADHLRITVPHRPEHLDRLLRALDAATAG